METKDEILKRIYYDPKIGLGGIDKLLKAVKGFGISKKETP